MPSGISEQGVVIKVPITSSEAEVKGNRCRAGASLLFSWGLPREDSRNLPYSLFCFAFCCELLCRMRNTEAFIQYGHISPHLKGVNTANVIIQCTYSIQVTDVEMLQMNNFFGERERGRERERVCVCVCVSVCVRACVCVSLSLSS